MPLCKEELFDILLAKEERNCQGELSQFSVVNLFLKKSNTVFTVFDFIGNLFLWKARKLVNATKRYKL